MAAIFRQEVKADFMTVDDLEKALVKFKTRCTRMKAKSTRVYIESSVSPCGTEHRKSLVLMAYDDED